MISTHYNSLIMLTLDVLIEILLKLPPESLFRLKSVSKSWNALISDPTFTSKHLSISLQQKHLLLQGRLVRSNSEKFVHSILKFPLDRPLSVQDLHFAFDKDRSVSLQDVNFGEDSVRLPMVNHSHGLVCLSGYDDDIFLCNMATRQLRKLPPSIIYEDALEHPPEDCYMGMSLISDSKGFGYDAKSKDFKVVRVLHVSADDDSYIPRRVEIYDLSKDRWREIDASGCESVRQNSLFDMYHEGKFYWWAYNFTFNFEDPSKYMLEIIQTFDISEEVFGQIWYPETMRRKVRHSSQSLGILNGSVVLFDCVGCGGNEKMFGLWKMEKDEFGDILWLKLLTIGPVSKIEYALLFVSSNELLMECDEGELILYDIRTGNYEELPIKGYRECKGTNSMKANFFVKSLLSVEGGNVINYEF